MPLTMTMKWVSGSTALTMRSGSGMFSTGAM
jgi:hypothetical protein